MLTLTELAAKKIAEKSALTASDIDSLPIELKERVLQQLPPEKLFNFWYANLNNPDIYTLGLSLLSKIDEVNKMHALASKFTQLKSQHQKEDATLALQQLILFGEFSDESLRPLAQFLLIKLSTTADNVDSITQLKESIFNQLLANLQKSIFDTRIEDFKNYVAILPQLNTMQQEKVINALFPLLTSTDFLLSTSTGVDLYVTLLPQLNPTQHRTILNALVMTSIATTSVSAEAATTVLANVFHQLEPTQRHAILSTFLVNGLKHVNYIVRDKAIHALTTLLPQLNPREHDTVITTAFSNLQNIYALTGNVAVKAFFTRSLPYFNPTQFDEVITTLLATLEDRDECRRVIKACATAFPQVDAKQQHKVINAIFTCLQDPGEYVRNEAISACTIALPHLDAAQRPAAINALLEHLHQHANSMVDSYERIKIRSAAIEACAQALPQLSLTQRHEVINTLFISLQDNADLIRSTAVTTLAKRFSQLDNAQQHEALNALLECLQDSDFDVHPLAFKAYTAVLPQLNPTQLKKVTTTLLPRLKDSEDLQRDIPHLAAALPQLDITDQHEAIDALLKCLQDTNKFVRHKAFIACATIFSNLTTEAQQKIISDITSYPEAVLKIVPLLNQKQCEYLQSQFAEREPHIAHEFKQLADAVAATLPKQETTTAEVEATPMEIDTIESLNTFGVFANKSPRKLAQDETLTPPLKEHRIK